MVYFEEKNQPVFEGVVVLATVVASMIVEEGDHWIQVGYSHLAVLWAMVGD